MYFGLELLCAELETLHVGSVLFGIAKLVEELLLLLGKFVAFPLALGKPTR